MGEEPEKALEAMTKDTRLLAEGLEAEVREDAEKVQAGRPKRPWWKIWARP